MQKPNLFNVAITRGKNKVINFVSRDPAELPDGHFRHYISFMQQYQDRLALSNSADFDENVYKNSFEREVASFLRDEGFNVVAGQTLAGFSADLTVQDPTGRTIVVECDGVEDNARMNKTQIKKQTLLTFYIVECKINLYFIRRQIYGYFCRFYQFRLVSVPIS